MDENKPSILTPYHAFYIQSMFFETSSALDAISKASEIIEAITERKLGPQDRKDELLMYLQNFVNHSGAIARYFFPSMIGGKGKKILHKNRADFLRQVFDVTENSPLHDKKLRNAIEHFDERLDMYLEDGIVGRIFPSLILNKPEETDVPHHIFRAYYLNDGTYQILGERHDIEPILNEIMRVHNILANFYKNGEVFRK